MIFITRMTHFRVGPNGKPGYFAYLGADNTEELHTFASKLKMRRSLYRFIDDRLFYYWITSHYMHHKAVGMGAEIVSPAHFMKGE